MLPAKKKLFCKTDTDWLNVDVGVGLLKWRRMVIGNRFPYTGVNKTRLKLSYMIPMSHKDCTYFTNCQVMRE